MIRFVDHSNLDIRKWDACVGQSPGGLPYGFSWWLDVVCPEWAALVMDDYVAVMPLPVRRKFGFSYIFQPYFTQQLGLFTATVPDAALTAAFLSAVPDKFRYVRVHLNARQVIPGQDFHFSHRRNYELSLAPSAADLAAGYHRNCRRNIQKAKQAGLTIGPGPGPTVFAQFIRQHLDRQLERVPQSIYPTLARLVHTTHEMGTGHISGVYDTRHDLVAAGWFVLTPARCLFLVCASTTKGHDQQAMYLLVDDMIGKQAGSDRIFDFTGSNIPGVAYFNAGFGAKETYYPGWVRNTLPWPLRIRKA